MIEVRFLRVVPEPNVVQSGGTPRKEPPLLLLHRSEPKDESAHGTCPNMPGMDQLGGRLFDAQLMTHHIDRATFG